MTAPAYIEKMVASVLRSSKEISDICGGKCNVFPLKIPQGAELPAVVFQRITSSPDYTLQGYSSEGVDIMINCFALTYEKAKELALAVRKAMSAAPLNAIFDSERDLLNETGDVFCVNAEYKCQQTGGYCYGSE